MLQGTACITLAGLLSALRATGRALPEQRVLFYGAGEAGTGIGELIAIALEHRHDMTREQARRHCWFMDSKGLVVASRLAELQPHKVGAGLLMGCCGRCCWHRSLGGREGAAAPRGQTCWSGTAVGP